MIPHIEFYLFHVVEPVYGAVKFQRNFLLRERLEIQQTGITPPNGFFGLNHELLLNFFKPFLVDFPFLTVPYFLEVLYLIDT
jgi:hypothetical protein